MKKLTATFALIAFSLVAFAQGEPFTKFYTKYADNEQFTQVTVTSKMFSLFTNIEPGDPNEKEVLDAMSKLKGLKVLAADSTKDARKYYKEAAAGFTGFFSTAWFWQYDYCLIGKKRYQPAFHCCPSQGREPIRTGCSWPSVAYRTSGFA